MKKSIFESLKFFCAAILCLCLSAFATPARAALPSGYTELEYIESTGTQIIVTDFVPTWEDTIEADYELTNLSATGDKFLIGAQPTDVQGSGFWVETYGEANSWYVRYGSNKSATTFFKSSQTSGTFILSKSSFVVNGTRILTPTADVQPTLPMSIFGRLGLNGGVTGAFVRFSNIRVKRSNVLTHNFVPAKNSSGKIGMYDTVNNRFYTNAGTGEFIAGDPVVAANGQCDFDIANIYKVGTPTITNAGIYTTNSSESYIRTRNDVAFATANTWSFKWRFTYHPANSDQGIMSGDGGTNVQAIINSAGRPRFSFGNDTSWNVGIWNDTSLTFAYQDGVTYDNEIYFDGTRYGFKVNGTEIGGVDNTTKAANTYFAIGVERQRTSTQYSRAEWDLTHTSLTLDGVEQLPWCGGSTIKIATTKYNETKFSPLNTALQNAISVVDSVVSNTITQAASIATLQAQKQTRPADDPSDANNTENCPAGKKCLLVTDTSGIPHWYEIVERYSRLPDGYTELEYIESTGTQYIDTGVYLTNNHSLDVKFMPLSSETGSLFGARNSATGAGFGITGQTSLAVDLYGAGQLSRSRLSQAISLNNIYSVHMESGNRYIKNAAGTTLGTNTVVANAFTINRSAPLFAINWDTNEVRQFGWFRVYEFTLKENGTAVRNFIPAKNSSSVVGMYDLVSGTFFTNAGTGEFVAGPVAE